MARTKKDPLPLQIRSFTVSAADLDTLQRLSSDLTDSCGRGVSMSGVVRAFCRLVEQHAIPLALLTDAISAEVDTGRKWGKG